MHRVHVPLRVVTGVPRDRAARVIVLESRRRARLQALSTPKPVPADRGVRPTTDPGESRRGGGACRSAGPGTSFAGPAAP